MPDDKAQRNFTDPDSRIMPSPGGRDFQQSYNCQAVVDSAHQVIVAARATNQPSDKQQAVPMVEEAIGNVGAVPKEVSADAGYYSAKAVEELYALGVDPFVAPDKTRHGRVLEPAPRGRTPQGLSVRDRMRRKLRTKRGRERYALRMETVEPMFGQIKQGRGLPAVPAAGPGEGEPGVAAHLYRPQPAETVPLWGREAWQGPGHRPRRKQQGLARDCNLRDIPAAASVHLSAPHQDGSRRLVPPQSLPVSYSSDGLLD